MPSLERSPSSENRKLRFPFHLPGQVRHTIVFLFILFGLTAFFPRDRDETGVNIAQGMTGLLGLLFAGAVQYWNTRNSTSRRESHSVAVACWIGFMVACSVASINSWSLQQSLVRVCFAITLVAIAGAMAKETDLNESLAALHSSIFIYLVVALAFSAVAPSRFPLIAGSEWDPRMRLSLFAGTPVYAAYLLGIAFLLGLRLQGRGMLLRQVMLITGLVLTFTRWALICVVLAWLLHAVRARKQRVVEQRRLIALLCLGVTLILSIVIAGQLQPSLFEFLPDSFAQSTENLSEMNGRRDLLTALLESRDLNWIFGHGLDGHRYIIREISPWAEHAHNIFLELLLSAGVVGALSYWVCIGIAARQSIAAGEGRLDLAGVVFFWICDSMLDPMLLTPCGFLLLGLFMIRSKRSTFASICDQSRPSDRAFPYISHTRKSSLKYPARAAFASGDPVLL